ncbi:selenocysteine insertion sequence-binding protein 2-like [Macrosteles quadrilineatus]|uniref:selenocysteine insertion sequence-binding protein 2-like n=1 Tax=Macrosteles quadrilineatus TaxID=74068 RepID=UPI0023E0EA49|nr:selenocysteine insertion sequence-binding protein 2-like [Macrosteles quadrilineatus]
MKHALNPKYKFENLKMDHIDPVKTNSHNNIETMTLEKSKRFEQQFSSVKRNSAELIRNHVKSSMSCNEVDTSALNDMTNSTKPFQSDLYTNYPVTRDEIVSRRKIKVTARKHMKKLEKLQTDKKEDVALMEKPSFSLGLASEDFPTLGSSKTKKKINPTPSNTFINEDEIRNRTVINSNVNEIRITKIVEKSWKPKVKDPIQIDLSRALLSKTEVQKPAPKKVDPPTTRTILTGNILDSDNPTRRKGKVRPDKVQKPSKLKIHILNERKKKSLQNGENIPMLDECLEPTADNNGNPEQCSAKDKVENIMLETNMNSSTCENKLIIDQHLARECVKSSNKDDQKMMSSASTAHVHSRRFREYCTNCLTVELTNSVCDLLEKVAYFQDRLFVREPIKANAKRRYVAGINQVNKYLQVKKVKLLIIAPDLEKNPGEGGLDEKVEKFKVEAELQGIPCIFGPNRKRLGKAVKKNTLVSCVAVLSYEGAEELYSQVLETLHESRTKYLRLTGTDDDLALKTAVQAEESDVTSSLLASLREEILPADRLLNAIHVGGARAEE